VGPSTADDKKCKNIRWAYRKIPGMIQRKVDRSATMGGAPIQQEVAKNSGFHQELPCMGTPCREIWGRGLTDEIVNWRGCRDHESGAE